MGEPQVWFISNTVIVRHCKTNFPTIVDSGSVMTKIHRESMESSGGLICDMGAFHTQHIVVFSHRYGQHTSSNSTMNTCDKYIMIQWETIHWYIARVFCSVVGGWISIEFKTLRRNYIHMNLFWYNHSYSKPLINNRSWIGIRSWMNYYIPQETIVSITYPYADKNTMWLKFIKINYANKREPIYIFPSNGIKMDFGNIVFLILIRASGVRFNVKTVFPGIVIPL